MAATSTVASTLKVESRPPINLVMTDEDPVLGSSSIVRFGRVGLREVVDKTPRATLDPSALVDLIREAEHADVLRPDENLLPLEGAYYDEDGDIHFLYARAYQTLREALDEQVILVPENPSCVWCCRGSASV
jgi:hypothetical protein